jgi:hypothetical protein
MSAAAEKSPVRDRIAVAALVVYVAILAFGTLGALFDVDWILKLF